MNLDKFFKSIDKEESNDSETLMDFKSHPLYNLLMFKKMILNHLHNKKNLLPLIKQINPKIDDKEAILIADSSAFNKAFSYLIKVDINDNNYEVFKNQYDDHLKEAINESIKYFSSDYVEKYENCIILKSIQDKLGNSK